MSRRPTIPPTRLRGRIPAWAAGIRLLPRASWIWLAGSIGVGLGQAVLLIAQAHVLSGLLAAALDGRATASAAARSGTGVALLAAAQGLAAWAWETCTESASRRARSSIRLRATLSAVRQAATGRARGSAGGIAALAGPAVDELDPFVARVLPAMVLALAVPCLLLAWIARLDLVSAGLAALVLAVGPVLAGLAAVESGAAVRRRLDGLVQLGDRFAGLMQGLPVLRAYGRARDHERAVDASGEDVRLATLAALRLALLAGLVLEVLAAVGTALVAVRLGLRLDAGQQILPMALAVLMLTPELFVPLRRLLADFHAAAAGQVVLDKIGTVIAADRHEAGRAARPGATMAKACQVGTEPSGVVLEGVCLDAPGRRRPVLDHITIQIMPGERVGLAGGSGAGKSSLLRVIAGIVQPSAGAARLGGAGAGPGQPAIGWVAQHPAVLPATVLDNVALGRPGVGERDAIAALEAAQLGAWLRSLPDGLHTALGELGAPLSLGERRRLAIARNIAAAPPGIWLLDEPTADLDVEGAQRLVTELASFIGGVTTVIASHDPLALALADRRIELCDGRIRRPGARSARPERAGMSVMGT